MSAKTFGEVRQLGYLTDDLDKTVNLWMTKLGIGPFLVFRDLRLPGMFMGEPTEVHMDVAFGFRGNLQIEIIQQTNDRPSPYRKNYETGLLGLHHVAFLSDDFDADTTEAAESGLELCCLLGDKIMGRYAYFADRDMPGVYCEFLENTSMLKSQWKQHIERCASWDGMPKTIEVTIPKMTGPTPSKKDLAKKWVDREQEFHERAIQEADGYDNFGDPAYLEGMRRVLDAYDREADFHRMGRFFAEYQILGLLKARLRSERLWANTPRAARIEVDRPLFITGMVRTGSTALHYLMGANPDTQALQYFVATHPQPRPPRDTWEENADYQQSVNELNMMYSAGEGLEAIHHITADGPEECRHLLAQSFTDDCFEVGTNVPSYAEWYRSTHHIETYRRHKRMIQLIGSNDANVRWLLKYPGHLPHLKAIFEVYPDACIIQTHRDPASVMSSYVSLCSSFRRLQDKNCDRAQIAREQMEYWASAIESAMEVRKAHPNQFYDVNFFDFMDDPVRVIEGIYDNYGVTFTERARAAIVAYKEAHPPGMFGKHDYSKDDYGIPREAIHDRFAKYLDHFDILREGKRA